jgi:hypothetical protein
MQGTTVWLNRRFRKETGLSAARAAHGLYMDKCAAPGHPTGMTTLVSSSFAGC